MMVVQAGAERRVLDDDERRRRARCSQTIEQIGRGALTEMRRLVGMLRSDDATTRSRRSRGSATCRRSSTQVREAGLPVELHVEGERRELPVGIELSAYRIVQEALTNALKHAGDARASVHVRYGADSLELEIVDDGAGGAARRRRAAATGSSACASGSRSTAARFDAGRRPERRLRRPRAAARSDDDAS